MGRLLLGMRSLLTGLMTAAAASGWLAGAPASAAAAAAPAAPAATGTLVASPRFVPEYGPILAGDDRLAWVTRRDGRVLDLWVSGPERGPRRIQRFVGSDTERLRSPRLSASSTAVGLELLVADAGRSGSTRVVRSRTYLGAFGQPLREVGSCAGVDPAAPRSIDVQQSAVVFRGPACGQVTVRAFAQDAVAVAVAARRLPNGIFATRLAGPFEAWLEQPAGAGGSVAAVVRDGASGREVTRVWTEGMAGAVVEQALRPDGTLALLYRRRVRDRRARAIAATGVAIVDPGATYARTLPLTVLAPESVGWIGAALGAVAAAPSGPGAGVLQIVDSAGTTVQRIVELGTDRELMSHTDVTAARAAWVTRGCESAQIRTISLPAPATVQPRTPRCGLRLRRRARLHADRLRLGVSCAGFSIDCAARVTVRAGRGLIARGSARYNRSTPPYAAADLKVSAAGMRILRRASRTRLRISARIGESGLLENPSLPGTVTRRVAQTVAVGRR